MIYPKSCHHKGISKIVTVNKFIHYVLIMPPCRCVRKSVFSETWVFFLDPNYFFRDPNYFFGIPIIFSGSQFRFLGSRDFFLDPVSPAMGKGAKARYARLDSNR